MILYTKDDQVVHTIGDTNLRYKSTIDLDNEEKIVGVRGKIKSEYYQFLIEFQFLIKKKGNTDFRDDLICRLD